MVVNLLNLLGTGEEKRELAAEEIAHPIAGIQEILLRASGESAWEEGSPKNLPAKNGWVTHYPFVLDLGKVAGV